MKYLRNLITAFALAGMMAAVPGYADTIVYSQNFTTDPGAIEAAGNDNSVGAVGSGEDIEYGEVAYSSLLTASGFSTSSGKMEFTQSALSSDTQNAAAILLDTSAFAPGTYSWSFNILDYTAGGANTEASFSVFEGNNAGGGDPLTLRLGSANNPTNLYPIEDTDGASTFIQIGSKNTFSSNGPYSLQFSLTEAGSSGDYLALTWSSNETANQGGVANITFSVDDIQLSVVPEPSTLALLGAGAGLLFALRRRMMRG